MQQDPEVALSFASEHTASRRPPHRNNFHGSMFNHGTMSAPTRDAMMRSNNNLPADASHLAPMSDHVQAICEAMLRHRTSERPQRQPATQAALLEQHFSLAPHRQASSSTLPSKTRSPNRQQHLEGVASTIPAEWEHDSDSEDDLDLLEDEDVEVVVGPRMAVVEGDLSKYNLPNLNSALAAVPISSTAKALSLSDCLRLSKARDVTCPLSFGSVEHISSQLHMNCRPCMYERRAGKCARKWLCDFCHVVQHYTAKSAKKGKKFTPVM
eukprot:gnl/TRDRNA2_/TRDRNA2_127003_c0_seq1.p1 gnl/TRDRNA2_/TRDRNA2_127003_c0~~gnl/TRDRNA2_/TRDRNA2_127003_c0_seq1.p1  ORF type:complete len:293 (+),score=40.88 gnl/TRDRNA2_/TRDRNA2_127003_c0_seq1:77-880(+)